MSSLSPSFPPEYTRGWVEFYYQKFVVNENVLIPRFETECLVREAVRFCKNTPPDILIDIGTGSGIIPLSILSEVHVPSIFAVDISPEAIEVAKENSKNQEKNIVFLESDLLGIFLETPLFENNRDIFLTANLPYIKSDDWENMSADTRHEPREALFGGEETGFETYERFFSQIPVFIGKYQPKSLTILTEMGDDQKKLATKIGEKHGWKFLFFWDLRGMERFMRIEIL